MNKNDMTNKCLNSFFLMVIVLLLFCRCEQSIHQKKVSNKSSFKTAQLQIPSTLKGTQEEKPAVIYRSTDLGATWFSFAKGIPEDATLSGIKQERHKIYVTTDYHGVFFSTNGQNNWQQLDSDKVKGLDINCIEVNNNQLVIGTLNNGVIVSNDAGVNWKQAEVDIKNTPIRAFIKYKEKLYAGTDSGIFQSIDMGNTWSHIFGNIQILGFTLLNNKIYAATQNGVLVWDGGSSNWESIYEGDALHDVGNDGKYIYSMTIGQQLLKTQNDGEIWDNAQSGITQPANFYTNELKHIGKDIFSAQWLGIYHSSNNGIDWKKLSGLPDSTAFSTLEITDYGIIAGISIR